MPTPDELEIGVHSLLTMLGVWLGLTVLVRSRTLPGRLFAVLSLMLAAWSAAVIVEHLAPDPGVDQMAHAIQEIAVIPVIPIVAHIALVVAVLSPTRVQTSAIVLAYALNVLVTLPAIVDPQRPIRLDPPHFTLEPVPVAALFGAWVAVRFGTMLVTALWMVRRYHLSRADAARRRQMAGLLVTLLLATLGGGMRILPVLGESDPWIGIALITAAMLCAAWTVFSTGVFLSPAVAAQAFWSTLAAGAMVGILATVLVAVNAVSRRILGVEMPVLAVAALLGAAALYEPVTSSIRRATVRGTPRRLALERLLHAAGFSRLATQPSVDGVRPALERLAGTLDIPSVAVLTATGEVIAAGTQDRDAARPATVVPLVADGEAVGELHVATFGLAGDQRDPDLVAIAAHYLAAALRADRSESRQLLAMHELGRERAGVEAAASELDAALAQRAARPTGLAVHALGPMRVQLGGRPIERWGGQKAGSRQAQALFAFLFDRGERGVSKDEALELAWPDVPIDRADLAFHRTVNGLRSTLEAAGGRDAVRHHNGRYRLDPSVVSWSDVEELSALMEEAGAASPDETERLLHRARVLYRGPFLDDCPIYGDSAFVEERRTALRARFADLLTDLAEASEAQGHRATAVAAYRDAIAESLDGNARAEAGLMRLTRPA